MQDDTQKTETSKPDFNQVLADTIADVYKKAQELCKRMAATDGPPENVWFRNLLLGILNSAVQDFRSVEIGVQRMPALATWGARNLIELRAIAAHVLKSESNAVDFRDEFLGDIREFRQTLILDTAETHKRLLAEMDSFATTKPGPVMEVLLTAARDAAEREANIAEDTSESEVYKEVAREFGIDPERQPKANKQIAKLIGKSENFGLRYKLYSKFAHRTAFSIASNVMEGSLDELLPMLSTQANMDFFAIYSAIDNHLKAHGYQPRAVLWGSTPRT
jgi:hypothetical protein